MKYFIFLFYILWVSISISAFWLFRPFSYVDNFESRLVCTNGTIYQIGPSVIFSKDGTIDPWNGKKARKLCEHGMILDYNDSLKTPDKQNYRLSAVYLEDSSWQTALFAFIILGIFGILAIEPLRRLFRLTYKFNFLSFLIVFPLSSMIFALFFVKPFNNLYCQRKAIIITADFRRSTNRSGKLIPTEEESYIDKTRKELLVDCLKYNGL